MNSKYRPVSSVPQTAKLHHLTQADARRRAEEFTGGLSSDPHGGDDFVNVRQMLDPSLVGSSQPLTGKRTNKRVSDTDMQSAMLSN